MTNPATNFVFVNEINSSPDGVGDRQQVKSLVRSHARKHFAKEFKQKHKGRSRKEAAPQKWTPLASKDPGDNTAEFLLHDDCCPSSVLERPGLPDSDTCALAYGTDFPHEDDSAVIESHMAPLKSPPESANSSASASHASILRGDLATYCKACGGKIHSPIAQRHKTNQKGKATTRHEWEVSREQSPLEFLGAGRVDPFSSYPVEKPDRAMHELMDLNVTYLLPGLVPDDYQHHGTNSVNSAAKAWVSASLENSFLFHALLFCGSIHRDFIRCSKIYPDSPEALSHKLIVIRELNKLISSDRRKASRDEVILAILVLSSHEVMNVAEEKRKPFSSPLKTIQWLNVYGNIEYVPEHMKAVLDLVTLRGGIENIEMRGLAETIVVGDIVWSLNNSTKPVHPPLRIHETYIAAIKEWATSTPHAPVQTTFPQLQRYGITDDLLQILDAMGALSMAIDHYLQGKPAGLTIGQIARTRTAIQKRLLLLPTSEELELSISSSKPDLYECCRLTAVIFSVAVIFPIPNTYHVLQTLVQRLKAAIEGSGVGDGECEEVLLWMLVLGGIAALDKPERAWFVSQLAGVLGRLQINWDGAEDILEKFLWLDFACTPGGRQLWEEVVNFEV